MKHNDDGTYGMGFSSMNEYTESPEDVSKINQTPVRKTMKSEKIYHIRTDKMAMTVVTNVENDNKLDIGFAFCSKKDKFNKALGRKIARARCQMSDHKYHATDTFSGNSLDSIINVWGKIEKPRAFMRLGFQRNDNKVQLVKV